MLNLEIVYQAMEDAQFCELANHASLDRRMESV